MLQFVIIARDGTDEGALARRMDVRPSHLAGARKLKDGNNFIVGGAILNDAGQMCGSVMIIQFETQGEFDEWRENEPYINGRVWEEVEVKRFRVAAV